MANDANLVINVTDKGSIDKSGKGLKDLTREGKKAEGQFKSLASLSIGALKAVAGAATVAAGAVTAFSVASAKSAKELEVHARLAKTSVSEFESLSFAYAQLGIDAKGTADALNDVSERVGEFAAAGTGAFQDFADVMGLDKKAARELASELELLGGDKALRLITKQMDEANITASRQSFVLKSLSNDLETVAGLYDNNASSLNQLTKRYEEANAQLKLTSGQSAQLTELSTSFDLMTKTAGNATRAISSTLAPTMSQFFNDVIQVVPDATNTIIDFLNTFNEAGDIQAIDQIDRQLKDLAVTIDEGVTRGFDKMSRSMQENPLDFVRVGKYRDAVARAAELEAQRSKILDEQVKQEKELAEIRAGGAIGGTAGTVTGDEAAQNQAKIDALIMLNATELELINKQEKDRLALIASYRAQEGVNQQELDAARDEVELNATTKRQELRLKELEAVIKQQEDIQKVKKDSLDKQSADEEKAAKDKKDREQQTLDSSVQLITALGGAQSKAAKAALLTSQLFAQRELVTDQAVAIGKAYSQGGPIGALALVPEVIAGFLPLFATVASARAQGGGLGAGQVTQINEREAELFAPNSNGHVFTQKSMEKMMGNAVGEGGGGATNNFYFTGFDGASVTESPNSTGGTDVFITREEANDMIVGHMGNPSSEGFRSLQSISTVGRG